MSRTLQPTMLQRGIITLVRTITASPLTAAPDNVSLIDANYPTATAIDCTGLETILVGCEIDQSTGANAVTATVEALYRDIDPGVADGERWRRFLIGAAAGVTLLANTAPITSALPTSLKGQTGAQLQEIRVLGWPLVFLRIVALGGTLTNTTAARILATPGYPIPNWQGSPHG